MTAATRRLWLYGLALLLPSLVVGGLALGLLAREQERLAEREQAARDSRRAAVETRARLIAENIELLVGDVQSALMTTLLEAPAGEPRAFLTEWQATNPLVRDVFRATSDGRLVWGASGDPLRGWLGQGVPWSEGRAAPSELAVASASASAPMPADGAASAFVGEQRVQAQARVESKDEEASAQVDQARRDISTNVSQYKNARQAIQEVAKLRSYADVAAKGATEPVASPGAPAAPPASAEFDASATGSFAAGAPPAPLSSSSFGAKGEMFDQASTEADSRSRAKAGAEEASSVAFAPFAEPLTRSGWTPWRDGGGLHLFGWRELPDRTVIGLELRFDAIKARLGEVFPAAPEPGEAYALRDADGAIWHATGADGLPVAIEVPLAASALPGWVVEARTRAADEGVASSGGVLELALVVLLVLAIVAAGALLLRQARLSELEAAQKTSFVANVSHELKTPLTTIRLYAELLAEGRVRDEAKRADYLATIGQETQRLGRLVANVLDFSRLEQGKKKYATAPLDLAVELRRLAGTHAPRLAAAGLGLRLDAPPALGVVTDRDAVEQIVLNLLDNACKYASEGGEIALRLSMEKSASGERVRLGVADRGPGVPEGQRERIFEKFHRVDDRLTAERPGAGLGLSIARQLARGLDGDLRCEAREGGGAEFVLTLPLYP